LTAQRPGWSQCGSWQENGFSVQIAGDTLRSQISGLLDALPPTAFCTTRYLATFSFLDVIDFDSIDLSTLFEQFQTDLLFQLPIAVLGHGNEVPEAAFLTQSSPLFAQVRA